MSPRVCFYLAGIESYGDAPTFLVIIDYEQVRSIAADIADDREAAARVELELLETDVCTRTDVKSWSAAGCRGGPAKQDVFTRCADHEGASRRGATDRACS